ncbi:hypothetical protein [Vreelandella aquamarina]|uniref:hypothetical protein n=1 Tax=Vreelandella aquamarina TaxID=77097 RepID=UPI00384D7204
MLKQNIMWLVASIMAGSSLLVSADETADMVGTLGDKEYAWFVLRQGDDSNASFMEVGDQVHIEVTGFTDPVEWDAQEALMMRLTLEQGELVEASVLQLIGETAMPPLYTSEGGDISVVLSYIEREGRLLHVAGQVEGQLALQHTLDSPPVADEGVALSVRFDITAQKVAF